MYNPFSLEGKTILVTGASSGIGKATAIECSKMGAKVVLTGRNETKLQQTYDLLMGNGHLMIVADLSCDVDISTIVEKCPSIDGLVNNAGLSIILPTHFITRDKMEQVMSVNTLAPILLMQQLLKKKKLGKNGSVVFTSSISGPVIAGVGNVMYSTSKAAVCGFVKNAALDLASKNIRVNAVCPGIINTHIWDAGTISEEQLSEEMKKYPLKRFGKPEEVAHAIIYFLSDASSFTTGTNLVIDGGFTHE